MATEKKELPEKAKKKDTGKVFRRTIIILTVVLLLFIASETFGIGTVSSMNDSVKSFFSSIEKGPGYPYDFNTNTMVNTGTLSNDLLVLTDSGTVCLDSTAKKISAQNLTYTDPAMKISNGRAIVYDRGETRYTVMNRTKVLRSGNTDGNILTAAIGKKGNIAFAERSDSSLSTLYVYDNSYTKKIFEWECTSYSIVSVALSPDGKEAACAVIGSENGDIYSKIYIFDFDYSQPVATRELKGSACLSVTFTDRHSIAVLCTDRFMMIDDEGKKLAADDFGTGTVRAYSVSENGTVALVTSEYGNSFTYDMNVYSKNGDPKYSKKYQSYVRSVCSTGNGVTVLTADKLFIYNSKGETASARKADTSMLRAVTAGRYTYIFSIGKIQRV